MDTANRKLPLIAVVGPTASGKTALGIALAKRLNGEVVSADSMQVYEGMDIATAKPTSAEMDGVPHHLIGYVSCTQRYSAARFVADARAVIAQIAARGRQPILVGGAGLYVNSLVDNIKFAEESGDPAVRQALQNRLEREGAQALLEELKRIDPACAVKLHPNNAKRVVRALEIYYNTGMTMSEQVRRSRQEAPEYQPFLLGIRFENRQALYDRINQRVDIMLKNGLVEEAQKSFISGLCQTAVQAIGHKELFPYFRGEATLEACVETLKRETRRYAKRQMTWFSRDSRIRWISADGKNKEKILEEANQELENSGYYDIIGQAGAQLAVFG